MARERVVIVGAGIGGLSAAVDLCGRGMAVTVVERAGRPGGKLHDTAIGGAAIDTGPTVFTMRWVFDELFAAVGQTLSDHLTLTPAQTLARHSWQDGSTFDLHADPARSADAVGQFAGAAEAKRFLASCARAARVYGVLEGPFIKVQKPNLIDLTLAIGLHRPGDQWSIMPYRSMWSELGRYFHDPRLRQLFGRYATYCGASPFRAPATMMLIAHVEQQGVWLVEGGMQRIPDALAKVATGLGATLRYGDGVTEIQTRNGRPSGVVLLSGERIEADTVIVNADLGPVPVRRHLRPDRRHRRRIPVAPQRLFFAGLAGRVRRPRRGPPARGSDRLSVRPGSRRRRRSRSRRPRTPVRHRQCAASRRHPSPD